MLKEITIQIRSVHELKKRLADQWQIIHPCNEKIHDPRTLAKQLALGLCVGVPDLIAISPQGKVHFCEFKSENGSLNKAQEEFQLWAIRANLPHSVVRSVSEALKVFTYWGAMRDPDVEAE